MAMWDVWSPGGGQATQTQSNTWPGAGAGDLFYNGGNYGQSQDWYNSPISQNIREQDQSLAYSSWASRMGVANNDQSFNRWFYNQYPRFQQAYGQATMDNPTMTIDQFLATLPQYNQLLSEYNALSPAARGVEQSRWAPNARWIPR